MTAWTPDQFWEYVEGLTNEHVRDQMRDMMSARGLGILPPSPQVPADQIARTIALSYGRDPDEMTSILEMCDVDNRPVPIWCVYEEQAEALLAAYSVTRPLRATDSAPDASTPAQRLPE